jgi:Concanavalin A-like lectin/glucanases superfamily
MSYAVGPAFPADGAPHCVAVTRQCAQSSTTTTTPWDQITFYVASVTGLVATGPVSASYNDNAGIADDGGDLVLGRVGALGVSSTAAGGSTTSLIAPGSLDVPVTTLMGRISQVRLWSSALPASLVCQCLVTTQGTPAAWWIFEERQGIQSADMVNSNSSPAMFMNGVTWGQSQDLGLLASAWTIYVNGQAQASSFVAGGTSLSSATTTGFCLGGALSGASAYNGQLAEVRVWNMQRTATQILDNLHRPLDRSGAIILDNPMIVNGQAQPPPFVGSGNALLAYYTLDSLSANATTILDRSGAGANLTCTAQSTSWTAPVGAIADAELPEAWSGCGWMVPNGCPAVSACPLGVAEYGVNEVDASGNMTGALKRCYNLVQQGQWLLSNGLKVGPLLVQWVGQVQFNPTLIGYIEGAPPVPGENMIQTGVDYRGASTVQLNVADDVTYTYNANRDKGFDYSTTASLQLGYSSSLMVGFAEGVGVAAIELQQVESSENFVGAELTASGGISQQDGVSPTTGLSQSQLNEMDLDGYYMYNGGLGAGDGLGPRFVPQNVGYALVKSAVADQYAMRLATTGAVIGYQLVVNPNIPPDWNIVTFQINPYYIRQGCLDGQFGIASTGQVTNDPHFPAAGGTADASYFRVNEAYALKSKITAEEQRLANQYASYDAAGIGEQSWVDTNLVNANLSSAAQMTQENSLDTLIASPDASSSSASSSSDPTQLVSRSLWNSYVWTAYGGLFAETENTLDGYSETLGGSYQFSSMAGVDVQAQFELFGFDAQLSLNAMFGGHVDVSVSKSASATTDFGITVTVDLDRTICVNPGTSNLTNQTCWNNPNVNQSTGGPWNPNLKQQPWDIVFVNGTRTQLWSPQPIGGLVDAYRFMTFYLAPEASNTTEFWSRVVNTQWLQTSDPNAVALRQVQQGQGPTTPPCWRVLHRVTFVSRIQPTSFAPVTPESPVIALDAGSHYLLIQQLEPYVCGQGATAQAPQTWAQLLAAVTSALATCYGTAFPALTQPPTVTQVAELMAGYYGITVPA